MVVARTASDRMRMTRLCRKGVLKRLDRGLYEQVGALPTANEWYVGVALRRPQAVICLMSALVLHNMTVQIPREVWVGLEAGQRIPRWTWPRMECVPLAPKRWPRGITTMMLDEVPVRITDPTRTVADCWRFEHLIGLPVCLEATKELLHQRLGSPALLWEHLEAFRLNGRVTPFVQGIMA